MIAVNELRVGNWVSLNGSKNFVTKEIVAWVVVAIDIHSCFIHLGDMENMQEQLYSTIQPIPLTTEILEKAGFELDASYDIPEWHHKSGFWFHDAFFNNTTYSIRLMNNIDVELYFLHQLQNLYFALTGEELDIKL